jgi:hypothetical protein
MFATRLLRVRFNTLADTSLKTLAVN